MQPSVIQLSGPPSTAMHDLTTMLMLGVAAATLLTHLLVTLAVMNDALLLERKRVRLMFFGVMGWTFLALMSGLLGLLAYWLMHHSSFRTSAASQPPELNREEARQTRSHDARV